jgi:hypothetical protein
MVFLFEELFLMKIKEDKVRKAQKGFEGDAG